MKASQKLLYPNKDRVLSPKTEAKDRVLSPKTEASTENGIENNNATTGKRKKKANESLEFAKFAKKSRRLLHTEKSNGPRTLTPVSQNKP